MFAFLEVIRHWFLLKFAIVAPWLDALMRFFYCCIQLVHRMSGAMLSDPVAWDVCWSSVPYCKELTIVVRIASTFGLNKRVQGFILLQSYGRVYCLLIDGYEVVTNDRGSSKGDHFYGAIYLPDAVPWEMSCKKVKSQTTSSVRDRCTFISFGSNTSGLTSIQLTVLREKPNSIVGKEAALALEAALLVAKKQVCG